ncbi:hypothetical protein BCV70DRAFT_213011 [Testicularia cyperi]|uniref:BZIP domain-containing protein n=1 Tax=Testicularia cyperi TaxID=1882483 RepID=A0A317XIY3_9BASI|nr:hypothetical protein BCV70DRAFT_213011 [Testicularia cyperi]
MSSSPSSSATASSSSTPATVMIGLPQTPFKTELDTDSSSLSSDKKRKGSPLASQLDSADDDLDDSLSLADSSPSKSKAPSSRSKPMDPERRARLEARQARNRLSAQYSRERKKAHMESLESTVTTLKSENEQLKQQHDQDTLLRQSLEAKIKGYEAHICSLQAIVRTLLPSTSSLPSNSSASATAVAGSLPSSSTALSVETETGPRFTALPQDAHIATTNPGSLSSTTIAAPASVSPATLPSGRLVQQTSNEDVRLPAAEAICSDAPSLCRDAELEQSQQRMSSQRRAGSALDVNGSSIFAEEATRVGGFVGIPTGERHGSTVVSALSRLQQTDNEKAASAPEAEAFVSNFIDLGRLADGQGDAKAADQDSSTSKAAVTADSVPAGSIAEAATAAAAAGPAGAAGHGDNTGLSGSPQAHDEEAFGGVGILSDAEGKNADTSRLFKKDTDSTEQTEMEQPINDVNGRFELLTSPLPPSQRNMWEMATDAMLQDIYGAQSSTTDTSGLGSNSESSDSAAPSDVGGSTPFDLIDLDIEIEEPVQFGLGLGPEGCDDAAAYLQHGNRNGAVASSNDVGALDWQALLTSMVSAQ